MAITLVILKLYTRRAAPAAGMEQTPLARGSLEGGKRYPDGADCKRGRARTSLRAGSHRRPGIPDHFTVLWQVGRFTMKNTLSSISDARMRKTAYMHKQARPTFLSSWNLLEANAMYSSINVDSSDMALYSNPPELMLM